MSEVIRFRKGDRVGTIAAYGERVALQVHPEFVIFKKTIESAISWMEAHGWSIMVDEWRVA